MKRVAIVLLLVLVGLGATTRADDRDALELFEKQVRPLLVERCFKCHSARSEKLAGGLALDSRERILAGGASGPALVPGDPENSLIVDALRWDDETLRMPPKVQLAPEEIAAFEEWIRRGAPYPRGADAAVVSSTVHWAFVPPRAVAVPEVRHADRVRTPLDAFWLAKLEEHGLEPAPEADRRTLIRRLSFDLTGLPPSYEDVEAFVADGSSGAYERLVDRLLATPQYAERWARHWLDVARYSDTKGYVFEEERRFHHAWTYRDWVVDALAKDLPYDEFLVRQIAADRLVAEKKLPPSELAALGFLTLGRRFLNNANDIIDDRIDVVTRGTLALTVACARCHDHKYDPIPTEDYYSLHGIFAAAHEPAEPVLLDPQSKPTPERAEFEKALEAKRQELATFKETRLREIQAELRTPAAIGSYLIAAHEARTRDATETANDRKLRAFALEKWRTLLAGRERGRDPIWRAWFAAEKVPAEELKAKIAWITSEAHPRVAKALAGKAPATLADVAQRYGELLQEPELSSTLIGFRFNVEDCEKLFEKPDQDRVKALKNAADELAATHPGAPRRAIALEDGPPVEARILVRGNPGTPGRTVPRRFLAALSSGERKPFTQGSGRLELARAIASAENPLTARVIVNRVLGWHLGSAPVPTLSDFGTRSDPPSHPELIDWLARRFVADGWSLKKLHRLIVTSSLYRQAVRHDANAHAKDPENRLLWRANRRRLDWESLRDALLASSGDLELTVGGRPFDLFARPSVKRRTLYGFIDRQNLPGTLRAFDFANPDAHAPRRHETIVPQQALWLLNGPFALERAERLSELTKTIQSPEERVRALYRRVLARDPSDDEISLGALFVASQSSTGPRPAPTWQYGWGAFDARSGRASFTPLPHWKEGTGYQGGPALPDPTLGWCLLTADGGHPGNDLAHAVVRRWTSPVEGRVSIRGTLAHRQKEGDGVRARIVSSDDGLLGTWTVHDRAAHPAVKDVRVRKGTTIDFVVECIANEHCDSFEWAPVITHAGKSWDAKKDFAPPAPPPLSPWGRYAQVLLATNEFEFVD